MVKRLMYLLAGMAAWSTVIFAAADSGQLPVAVVEKMPNIPQPFKIIDWKTRARGFDKLAFDLEAKGEYLPLVEIVDKPVNFTGQGFALPSYVGAERGRGEGICCLAAVLSGTLVGIDKTNQAGRNWVKMCQEWYNIKNGQRVVLNNQSSGTGATFWYEVFPGMIFCQLAERYPAVEGMDGIMRSMADRWSEACVTMAGKDGKADFNWTGFNLATMQPVFNGRWREPDAAAGIGWMEYMAWVRWHDRKYLDAAKICMDFFERRTAAEGSPLYEVMFYYAPYLAARMNAETGSKYDVDKLMQWCFSKNDQKGVPRYGWGIIADRFGDYDCHGLQGSTTDGDGYPFAMSTFHAAGALVPMVRYDARYARAVGKWMLNLANASRLFYPDGLPAEKQSSPGWKSDPSDVVAYEGLRKKAYVVPVLVGEKTETGQASAPIQMLWVNHPVVFTADKSGKFSHTLQYGIPADAVEVAFWLQLQSRATSECFNVSASYDEKGPWQTLLKVPHHKTDMFESQSVGTHLADVKGHTNFFLRIETREGASAESQIRLGKLTWRVALDRSPFATGDLRIGGHSSGNDLGMYGSAHVGYLAALVEKTDHKHILQLDLLATDFFHDKAYPTYLYYNPDAEAREVKIDVGAEARDLYDATRHVFLKKGVKHRGTFGLAADSAAVVVVAPADGKLESRDGKTLINGVVVDYQ